MGFEDIIFAVMCLGFAATSAYFLIMIKKERAKQTQNKK